MVIRDLLDRLDREKEVHVAAAKRLESLKEEILSACRTEAKQAREGRKGASCRDQGARRAA